MSPVANKVLVVV